MTAPPPANNQPEAQNDHLNLPDPNRPVVASRFWGKWQKHALAMVILIILGTTLWPQRFGSAKGFLFDDAFLLGVTYKTNLQFFPRHYLPDIAAHRPIGRDAFTLMVRLFGENETPMIWLCLAVHLTSTLLLWQTIYRLTANWSAALAGACLFLLNMSAYLPIYWPVDIFDTLAAFFLVCLLLTVSVITTPRGKYRPWLLLLTLPLMLAAIKTKESTMVVAAPLLLMVVFAPHKDQQEHPGRWFRSGAIVQRIKAIGWWEAVWIILTVALVAALALTVITTRDPKDPTHPYYSDYSPGVIGRSFLFYLRLLFFQYRIESNLAIGGLFLMLAPVVVALLLKNRWMFFGWLWYVIYLFPLASFTNHYYYTYYPYPGMIGAALTMGCFLASRKFKLNLKLARVAWRALPLLFILLLVLQFHWWIRNGSVPQWFDNYHARSAVIMTGLKAVLPEPPNDSEIVLVIPEFSQFDQSPYWVLKVMYHNQTLNGVLFKAPGDAQAYVTGRRRERLFLATWKETEFELKDLSRR